MQNRPFNKATSSYLQRNLDTSYFVLQTLSLHMLLTKAGREPLVSLESNKGRWKTHKGLRQSSDKYQEEEVPSLCSGFMAVNQKEPEQCSAWPVRPSKQPWCPGSEIHPAHPTPFIFSLTNPANTLPNTVIESLGHFFPCESYFMISSTCVIFFRFTTFSMRTKNPLHAPPQTPTKTNAASEICKLVVLLQLLRNMLCVAPCCFLHLLDCWRGLSLSVSFSHSLNRSI